jgi:hypothetical protein
MCWIGRALGVGGGSFYNAINVLPRVAYIITATAKRLIQGRWYTVLK